MIAHDHSITWREFRAAGCNQRDTMRAGNSKIGFFSLLRDQNFFTPKPNNIKFYGSHITRGCPKSTQSENLNIIWGYMTILWPFSPFLHPPPQGPYLTNPSELGPVLRRASRGHIWLPHIPKLLMGKSLFVRNWCSKSANFSPPFSIYLRYASR